MNNTSAAQIIIKPLWPGPGTFAIFEVQVVSPEPPTPRFWKYCSRSVTRCSMVASLGAAASAGAGAGGGGWSCARRVVPSEAHASDAARRRAGIFWRLFIGLRWWIGVLDPRPFPFWASAPAILAVNSAVGDLVRRAFSSRDAKRFWRVDLQRKTRADQQPSQRSMHKRSQSKMIAVQNVTWSAGVSVDLALVSCCLLYT